MIKKSKFLSIVICLLGTTNSFASSVAELTKFGITVRVPPSLFTKMDKKAKLTTSNDSTQCLRFFFKTTKKYAGELCASSNPDFLLDRSVISYNSIPAHARSVERPESDLMAMSPLSQYPMEPFVNQNFKSYGAIIDCDEINDAVYRATSSCHIAVATFQSGKSFYSNFIVKSHINGSARVSIEDVKILWGSLGAL